MCVNVLCTYSCMHACTCARMNVCVHACLGTTLTPTPTHLVARVGFLAPLWRGPLWRGPLWRGLLARFLFFIESLRIRAYAHTRPCVCLRMRKHAHANRDTHRQTHTLVRVLLRFVVFVCLFVWGFVCVCVCVCGCACGCVPHASMDVHVCDVSTCARMYLCMHILMHACNVCAQPRRPRSLTSSSFLPLFRAAFFFGFSS